MAAVDIKALKERAAAARNIVHPPPAKEGEAPVETIAGRLGWTFTMRRPTDLQLREVFAGGMAAIANQVRFQTEQVFGALTAWTGPTVGDIDPTAGLEIKALPLPFDRDLCPELFGDRAALVDELGSVLMQAMVDRKQKREAETKNSPSLSGSTAGSQA